MNNRLLLRATVPIYLPLQLRVWCRVLDLYLAFEVEHAIAFEFDAVAGEAAHDLPAALRRLKCAKLGLSQSGGPVRRERAVSAAGNGIFRDALGRREVAAHEVIDTARACGDDQAAAVRACDCCDVRREFTHDLLTVSHGEVVVGIDSHAERTRDQGFEHLSGRW